MEMSWPKAASGDGSGRVNPVVGGALGCAKTRRIEESQMSIVGEASDSCFGRSNIVNCRVFFFFCFFGRAGSKQRPTKLVMCNGVRPLTAVDVMTIPRQHRFHSNDTDNAASSQTGNHRKQSSESDSSQISRCHKSPRPSSLTTSWSGKPTSTCSTRNQKSAGRPTNSSGSSPGTWLSRSSS